MIDFYLLGSNDVRIFFVSVDVVVFLGVRKLNLSLCFCCIYEY